MTAGGDCERISASLSDYYDGRFEPTSAEALEVESHLASCQSCARILEDFRAISAAAEELKKRAGSQEEFRRIRVAVATSLRKVVFIRRLVWTGLALSGMAAAAAVLAAIFISPKHEQPSQMAGLEVAESSLERLWEVSFGEASDRAEIERTLQEASILGKARPSEWMALHEEAELRRALDEIILIRAIRSRRDGPRPGVISVSDSAR